MVLAGKVKVCREAPDHQQVVVDIYQTDEVFAESALVGSPQNEMAVALDNVRVMSWNARDIRELSLRRPELALALLLHAGASRDTAIALHYTFMREFIAPLPRRGFDIELDIQWWIVDNTREG